MTGRSKEETAGVSLLGNQNVRYPDDYAPEVLETFVNKHPVNDYFVKFNCPEFTCMIRKHFTDTGFIYSYDFIDYQPFPDTDHGLSDGSMLPLPTLYLLFRNCNMDQWKFHLSV